MSQRIAGYYQLTPRVAKMATYPTYDEAVNTMSGGKGFAFLTSGQKSELDSIKFDQQMVAPVTSPTGVAPTKTEPLSLSSEAGLNQLQQDQQKEQKLAYRAPVVEQPKETETDLLRSLSEKESEVDKTPEQLTAETNLVNAKSEYESAVSKLKDRK